MKTLILILSLAATLCAPADVIIYQIALTNKVIGGGEKFFDPPLIGRMVIDVDSDGAGTLALIGWMKTATVRKFAVACPGATAKEVRGPKRQETILFMHGQRFDALGNHEAGTQMFLRGVNSPLPVSPTRTVSGPLVFNGVSHGVEDHEEGSYFGESLVSAVYLEAESKAANASGQSLSQVIEFWRQNRLSRGFIEVDSHAPCF